MKQNFDIKVLKEIFNYVKSTDLEFSLESVKVFFKCASISPNLNTFKEIIEILSHNLRQFQEAKNFTLIGQMNSSLNKFTLSFFISQK